MESEDFYMLYREGGLNPVKKHFTYEEAQEEAKRIAQKESRKVYILKTCAKVECKPCFEISILQC